MTKIETLARKEQITRELARRDFAEFMKYTFPKLQPTWAHLTYYKFLNKFAKGEIKNGIVSFPPQHGKQISNATRIFTSSGWKRHGDLHEGDHVIGLDGQWKKVLWESEETECTHEITFSDGSKFGTHENHDWLLHEGHRAPEKWATKDLVNTPLTKEEKGGKKRRIFKLPFYEAFNFDTKKLPIDPYVLGMWLGDGKSDGGTIGKPLDALVKIQEKIRLVGYDFGLTWPCEGYHKTTILGLITELKENNLCNNKHIPIEYLQGSEGQRKELLAGLMDSDGYIYEDTRHKKSKRAVFTNTNLNIIEGVEFLCRSFGWNTYRYTAQPTTSSSGIVGKHVVYQVGFTPNTDIGTVRLDFSGCEKKERKRSLVAIEKISGVYGKCIQVEGGVYLIGDTFVPTHNSEASTRRLPAYILGNSPDKQISVTSYSDTQVKKFSRKIKENMDDTKFKAVFPNVNLAKAGRSEGSRTANDTDIVGHEGRIMATGRGGGLTGNTVDIAIIDDLYKDAMEANSPIVRASVIDWYDTVLDTRLHNNSQVLIVFTRWHEEDLVGYLQKTQTVHTIDSFEQLVNIPQEEGHWVHINLEAIKKGLPTEIDPREAGVALWPERHSLRRLRAARKKNPETFESLYQGNPKPLKGLLYKEFKTYEDIPGTLEHKGYCDVADKGDDYLCFIVYYLGVDNYIYITDVLYSQEGQDVTAPEVAQMIKLNELYTADIESNSGGEGFARDVVRELEAIEHEAFVDTFYQGLNKESRILTNAPFINARVLMPIGWKDKWPDFAASLTGFKKRFKANKNDDAPDTLTGCVEKSGLLGTDSAFETLDSKRSLY